MARFQHTLIAATFGLALSLGAADAAVYTTRADFLAQLGSTVTDTYSAPGYTNGDKGFTSSADIFSDAAMSAVLGETTYHTITHLDANVVWNQPNNPRYCGGCNGSFLLTFDSTSVGTSAGVFGVGLNYGGGATATVKHAGPGGTQEVLQLLGSGFIGFTASDLIYSIAFTLPSTGSFWIDNLTIGSASVAQTPIPGALPLFASALGVGGLFGYRRKRKAATA